MNHRSRWQLAVCSTSSSRWASTNHTPLKSTWASRKGLCLALCCLQSTALGPLLFAVYCSPIADVIAHQGVQYHQYADDTQLHLAMRADNTPAELSVLAECTTDVRQWYLQNGLQLNPDKSKALIVGTTNQLRAVTSSVSSVSMAGVDLPVADDIKVLGVVLDRRLTFHKHVSAVARSCNYHAEAIRHIRHLLTTELAQTLADPL